MARQRVFSPLLCYSRCTSTSALLLDRKTETLIHDILFHDLWTWKLNYYRKQHWYFFVYYKDFFPRPVVLITHVTCIDKPAVDPTNISTYCYKHVGRICIVSVSATAYSKSDIVKDSRQLPVPVQSTGPRLYAGANCINWHTRHTQWRNRTNMCHCIQSSVLWRHCI